VSGNAEQIIELKENGRAISSTYANFAEQVREVSRRSAKKLPAS
jgi:hypothetical protein